MKKVAGTLFSQGMTALVALVAGILLPKYMGPTQYGYWQIYVFYLAYLNIAGIGFNDGLTLYYSGTTINELQQAELRTSIRFIIVQSFLLSVVIGCSLMFVADDSKRMVFFALTLNVVVVVAFCICQAIFLACNNIFMYNLSNLLYRVIPNLCFFSFLLVGQTSFENFIIIDGAIRILLTVVMCVLCRNFFWGKGVKFQHALATIKAIVSSGFIVMLTVFVSGLWLGAGRVIVERTQSIEVYGVYSFAVSLLSIILTFTSAIGIVFFPTIKSMDTDLKVSRYFQYHFLLEGILCCSFFVFIPISFVLKVYMPQYVSAVDYLAFLVASCLPLGEIQMLIFPYYKAFRLERALLCITISGFLLIGLTSLISYLIFSSVKYIAMFTMISLFLIYFYADFYLQKTMAEQISNPGTISHPITFMVPVFAFLLLSHIESLIYFGIMYTLVIVFYAVLNKDKIRNLLVLIKSI